MASTFFYGSIVGLSLGLTGGGGSIFAVPLLVYGLGLDFRSSVALSLAVVGLTSAYGATLQARRGMCSGEPGWCSGSANPRGSFWCVDRGADAAAVVAAAFCRAHGFYRCEDASAERCGNRCANLVDTLPATIRWPPPFQFCLQRCVLQEPLSSNTLAKPRLPERRLEQTAPPRKALSPPNDCVRRAIAHRRKASARQRTQARHH
jgi:hypothetical protein